MSVFFTNTQPGVRSRKWIEISDGKKRDWVIEGKGKQSKGKNKGEKIQQYMQNMKTINEICQNLGKCFTFCLWSFNLKMFDVFLPLLHCLSLYRYLCVNIYNQSHDGTQPSLDAERLHARRSPPTWTREQPALPTWCICWDNCLCGEPAEEVLWSLSNCRLKMGLAVPNLDLYYRCGNSNPDPRSALETDFPPLGGGVNRKQRAVAQMWANTAL